MVNAETKPIDQMAEIYIQHKDHDQHPAQKIQALIIDSPQWSMSRKDTPPAWLRKRKTDFADPDVLSPDHTEFPFDLVLDSAESLLAFIGMAYQHGKFGVKRTNFGLVLVGKIPGRTKKCIEPTGWSMMATTKVPKFYKARPHFFVEDIEVDEEDLLRDIARAHELDMVDIFGHTDEDFDALKKYMQDTTDSFIRKDGRVFVTLPKFQGLSIPLSHNLAMVQAQLQKLQADFLTNKDLEEAYVKAITEWIDLGVLVPVSQKDLEKTTYWAEMPYHPVFRQGVKTHKIRIVMNGSAKAKGTASLNEYLATGPNILPQILNIFSKFRTAPYFVVADIEKAFLQVGLLPPDDHLFIFRWLQKNSAGQQEQKLYRFARMPWGINCAPFVLNAVVRFLYDEAIRQAHKEGNIHKAQRLENLKDTTYVDDILALGSTTAEAVSTAKAAVQALQAGKMHVTKFRSYPPRLARQVDNTCKTEYEDYKILGVKYSPADDTLSPAADKIDAFRQRTVITKRQAAGIGARLFDPCGLTVPKSLLAKLLMQKVDKEHPKSSWAVKLSEQLTNEWHSYVDDVQQNIQKIKVPRLTRPEKYDKLRLCVFTDASSTAIAACLYEVAEVRGKMHPVLVSARNKIIPIKKRFSSLGLDTLTKDSLKINRLELTAALLGANMAQQHMAATGTKYDEVLAFTDSQVSCHWIWSAVAHHTDYVRKRVQAATAIIPARQWRHVPGDQNPADIASRGATIKELSESSLWFHGPAWLSQSRTAWPQIPQDAFNKLDVACSLVCCTRSMTRKQQKTQQVTEELQALLQPEATWDDLIRTIMNQKKSQGLSSAAAEILLLQHIQKTEAPKLYKNLIGQLSERELSDQERAHKHQYGLFFDTKTGLIISRSRNFIPTEEIKEQEESQDFTKKKELKGRTAAERDLIFLPATGPLVKQLVTKIHLEDTGHGSPNHVATEARLKYWILHVRKLAKDVKRHCSTCKKLDAKPLTQQEGPLPEKRFDVTDPQRRRPFYTYGIDFVGPFHPFRSKAKQRSTDTRAQGSPSVHIAVFSCAVTRAIHLEVVRDLSFEQFELAFSNFKVRRGTPHTIYSDNAKTFKVAQKLAIFQDTVAQKLQEQYKTSIEWIFNASRAPWWGGFFERMMRMIKEKLARNFYRHIFPSHEHFNSAVILLEKFINSRPLTTFYSDRIECAPITPNQFIQPYDQGTDFGVHAFCDKTLVQTKDMTPQVLRARRQEQNKFNHQLWYDFQCQYLDGLRQFHSTIRGKKPRTQITPGLCVLVTPDDHNFKPGAMLQKMHWKRAKVVKTIPGKDGKVRKVTIEWPTANGKWHQADYPIQKLCPVELNESEKQQFLLQQSPQVQ